MKVLLEAGADIYGLPRHGGKTAMQRAIDLDWKDDLDFLKSLEPLY